MTRQPSIVISNAVAVRRDRIATSTLPDHWHHESEKDKSIRQWLVFGHLPSGEPFMLDYLRPFTTWECPIQLGTSFRSRILNALHRLQDLDVLPEYVESLDITTLDRTDREAGGKENERIRIAFRERFYIPSLPAEPEYVDLAVPYADKDEARAAGAVWDGARKTWKIDPDKDMAAVERWMPPAAPTP